MLPQIIESDWRIFRELRKVALDRFSQGVLDEVARLTTGPAGTAHERYLAVVKLIQERDKKFDSTFDTPRRSTALEQLAVFQYHKLLTLEELNRLSAESRDVVDSLVALFRSFSSRDS